MINWNVTSPLEDELISENHKVFLSWWRPRRHRHFAWSFSSIKAVLLLQNTSEILGLSSILHHITFYISPTQPWQQSHMWKQPPFESPFTFQHMILWLELYNCTKQQLEKCSAYCSLSITTHTLPHINPYFQYNGWNIIHINQLVCKNPKAVFINKPQLFLRSQIPKNEQVSVLLWKEGFILYHFTLS